jgi:hypothetical protein
VLAVGVELDRRGESRPLEEQLAVEEKKKRKAKK